MCCIRCLSIYLSLCLSVPVCPCLSLSIFLSVYMPVERQLIEAATHRSSNSSKQQLIESWWGWQLIKPPLGAATHWTFYTWFKPLSMSCRPSGNSSNPLKGWQLIESPLGEATHRKHHIWSSFLHKSSFGERVFCTCSTHRKLKILYCHPVLT